MLWKWFTKRKNYVSKKEAKRLAKEGVTWEDLCREGKVKAIGDATKILDHHYKGIGEKDGRSNSEEPG